MRTTIIFDDELMKQALKLTGLKTRKEAAELGLKTLTLIRLKQQEKIKRYKGKLRWEGNLEAMSSDG